MASVKPTPNPGVAVVGSVASSVFTSHLRGSLGGLPAQAAAVANESLGAALQVAGRLGGPQGANLATAARQSYVDAMATGFRVGAVIALVAAGVAFAFLPARATTPVLAEERREQHNEGYALAPAD